MALTVTVGSGPVTLKQNGIVAETIISTASPIPINLPVASTAGTLLLAFIGTGNTTSPTISNMPAAWIKLAGPIAASATDWEVWIYPNNVGGIQSISPTANSNAGGSRWYTHMSEWSNVAFASALEASGTATATSGTTLLLTTTGNVLSSGDIAIASWMQQIGGSSTVTFTSPTGWTRLIDTQSLTRFQHLDVEYMLGPAIGSPAAPTLISDTTTTQAAGAIIVLKAAFPATDETALLRDPGPTIKFNTLDAQFMLGGRYQLEDGSGFYQLEDGSGDYLLDTYIPQLGDPVVTTNPSWSGRIVASAVDDLTELITNYRLATVTATNSATAAAGVSPVDLSDSPLISYYLLEDASGDYQLEDGSGRYALEGSSAGYRNLHIKKMQNQDGTVSIYGSLETFEGGFAPGQTFALTSTNLSYNLQQFTITNVTATFVGANPRTALYFVEFGDAYPTLQSAGGGVLTRQAAQAGIQAGILMPAGTLGYAQITDSTGLAALPNLTDIQGLAVTVTTMAGRRILVRGFVTYTKHTAGLLALDLFEGATQLSQWIITAVDAGTYTASVEYRFVAAATATHTYKLTVGVNAGTADVTPSTNLPNFIEVSDIGT